LMKRKKAKPKKKGKKPVRRKASKKKAPTALVKATPAPAVKAKPWVLREEQVALLKRTVAKGTTDDEFALFLWVAKKHKLDPMTRQLHAVKRWSRAENREVMAIQIGIDGYRSMAARNHRDYGGVDEPEYEMNQDGSLKLARVRVWKKGFGHPTVGVAFWKEYAPLDLNKPQAFMWVKMPKGQLAKCAEALALRKAYPELADIYTDEEMAQADDDYSPGGREITVDGQRPSQPEVTQAAHKRHAEVVKELGPRPAPKTVVSKPEHPEVKPLPIESYKEVQWRRGKRSYIEIVYGGHTCSCWRRDLYPHLKAGVGQLARLGVQRSGKYLNVEEIYSIGDKTFSQIEGKSVPDHQWSEPTHKEEKVPGPSPAAAVPREEAATESAAPAQISIRFSGKKALDPAYISGALPKEVEAGLPQMKGEMQIGQDGVKVWQVPACWISQITEELNERGIEWREE
jgi:phage recombination protein Bet